MAMALHPSRPDASWDHVNTFTSFMFPDAKRWTRKSQGRTIKIIPSVHNSPKNNNTPEDNQIHEIPRCPKGIGAKEREERARDPLYHL